MSILFGRIESEPVPRESPKDNVEFPHLSHYGPNAHRIMEKLGNDLIKRSGFNFDKGK